MNLTGYIVSKPSHMYGLSTRANGPIPRVDVGASPQRLSFANSPPMSASVIPAADLVSPTSGLRCARAAVSPRLE